MCVMAEGFYVSKQRTLAIIFVCAQGELNGLEQTPEVLVLPVEGRKEAGARGGSSG